MKIAAIIVTCNRKDMLTDMLNDLGCQNRKPDGVIVVDNGSEDGTQEFIKEQYSYVQLIELKNNLGLFPGLATGIRVAFEQDYDSVWLVDDDARLQHDTLEQLLNSIKADDKLRESVIWCANIDIEGQLFTEPLCVKVDNDWKVYKELLPELKGKVYETLGGPNIGIYIHRSVIDAAGPPREDMIFCGESEFIYRVTRSGFKMYRCFESIIYHKRHEFYEVNLFGRTRYVAQASPWRIYYEIRNRVYMDRVFKIRPVLRSLFNILIIAAVKIYYCNGKLDATINAVRGIYDGLRGRLGMRVHIPRRISAK